MTLAALSSSQFFWLVVLGLICAYFMFNLVIELFKAHEQERSRREALAYVAEGTMTAEVAERLLAAGKKAATSDESEESEIYRSEIASSFEETKRAIFKLVPAGVITSEEASRLVEACRQPEEGEATEEGASRFAEQHETSRAVIADIAAGKLGAENARQMLLTDRPIMKISHNLDDWIARKWTGKKPAETTGSNLGADS